MPVGNPGEFQTIPALPTASNACSTEKTTFYSVSWIKRQ